MRKIAENHFIGDYKISDEVCNSLVELFHKVPVAPNNFKRENIIYQIRLNVFI